MQLAKVMNKNKLASSLKKVNYYDYQDKLFLEDGKINQKIFDEIIEEGNAYECFECARILSELNLIDYVQELENVIAKSKKMELIVDFAQDVKGANIERLQTIVENSFNPYYCLRFAKEVQGADIASLVQVIADSGEMEICIEALTKLDLSATSKELLIFSIKASAEDLSLTSLKLDIEDMLIKNGRTI